MSAACTCGQPALVQCLCQTPPTSFCSGCLSNHVFTTVGGHRQRSVVGSSVCHQCRLQLPVCLCSCNRIPLCESCYGTHKSSAEHLRLPLLEGEKSGQALGFAEALLAGLEEGKAAQNEAIEALNQLISTVHNYKLSFLSYSTDRLKKLERVINGAVQEISEYHTHPSMVPSAEIQTLLLLSESELRTRFRFVTLTRSPTTSSLELFLHKSIDILISTQLPVLTTLQEPVKYLPLLGASTFFVTTPPFNTASPLNIENLIFHNNFTVWCYLPSGSFLATGEQESKSALSIDCGNKYAFPLKETLDEHYMGGIIFAQTRVYLLGGQSHSIATATAEVYDVYEDHWTCLPDMLIPRWHFQPSYYERFIYIFGGGQNSEMCERLNLDNNSFEPLSLSIPGGYYLTSLCSSGVFYIFFKREIYAWEGGELREAGVGNNPDALSFLSPVVTEGAAYFFGVRDGQEHLLKFDLSELRLDWCISKQR